MYVTFKTLANKSSSPSNLSHEYPINRRIIDYSGPIGYVLYNRNITI